MGKRKSFYRVTSFVIAGLANVAWATACGDGGTQPTPPDALRATSITISPATAGIDALGATVQLTAEVRDQNGQVMAGTTVAWVSDDRQVVTVSASGLVAAAGNGRAMIRATAGSVSGSATVTVSQAVSRIQLTPAADTIAAGDTLRLAREAVDQNGHRVDGAVFTWTTSDESVVHVDGAGLVTAVAQGSATITAIAGGAQGSSGIKVENPDRAALVALYRATDGTKWVNNENWLTDAPLEEWYGVGTDNSGRVVRLVLGLNELSGSIPPELGSLTNLERLEVPDNQITGLIPTELGNLTQLTDLELDDNDFTGPIPPELGNLTRLTNLELDDNNLAGPVPAGLGNLSELTNLELNGNDLTGTVPPEFGSLGSLRRLTLRGNRLTGEIPEELGNLRSLRSLDLSANELFGALPLSLARLSMLESFRYTDNRLCVPVDKSFRAWLDGLASHIGTGVDCGFRLDFDDASEIDGWKRTAGTVAEVRDGVLELGSTEGGDFGLVYKLHVFDPPVDSWRASAGLARTDTVAFAALWLETDHSRWQTIVIEVGSGLVMGVDTAAAETNWRVLFWDNDLDGPDEGGWVYFPNYGYGWSANVAANEVDEVFTATALELSSDTLRALIEGDVLFEAPLPEKIRDAGATAIQGVWMAFRPRTASAKGTARFDWIEVSSEATGGGTAAAVAADRIPGMTKKAAANATQPIRIRAKRR
jgi:hypothetical protein